MKNLATAIRQSLSVFEHACVYHDVDYKNIIFKDVDRNPDHEAIDILRTYCIVKGYGGSYESKYYKDAAASKAEVIKVISKVDALPDGYEFKEGKSYSNNTPYKDMKRNSWYTTYVVYAYQKGFLEGIGKKR